MALLDKFNQKSEKMNENYQEQAAAFTEKVDKVATSADSNVVFQGLFGNYSKQEIEGVYKKWSQYLVENEQIISAYRLVRDELIITNFRIIFIDVQGVTGQKKAMTQIFLDSIVDVSYTSAGFGFDDIDMFVTFMANPFKKSNISELRTHHFEFPKKHDVTDLYRFLMTTAMRNRIEINQYK